MCVQGTCTGVFSLDTNSTIRRIETWHLLIARWPCLRFRYQFHDKKDWNRYGLFQRVLHAVFRYQFHDKKDWNLSGERQIAAILEALDTNSTIRRIETSLKCNHIIMCLIDFRYQFHDKKDWNGLWGQPGTKMRPSLDTNSTIRRIETVVFFCSKMRWRYL